MTLKEFFKILIELPKRHIQLLTERIEEVKRNKEINRKCIEISWHLPNIKHEDIIQARESLIKGDSVEAIKALIQYINKASE